jgi:hypothetical protein
MKIQIQKLQSSVNTARHELASAQAAWAKMEADAKIAKNKSRQLKLQFKDARTAAKQAKKRALTAQETLQQKTKLLAKATRRLEKAYKKQGKKPASAKPTASARKTTSAAKSKNRITAAPVQTGNTVENPVSPKSGQKRIVPGQVAQPSVSI